MSLARLPLTEPIAGAGASCVVPEPSKGLDAIEAVVQELCRISRSATLEFAIRVGELIIDRFYDGDMEKWRRRGPKQMSFRKLAAHPLLPMSPGALYRTVAICELYHRLEGRENIRHLSRSHFRAVLSVSEADQVRLLSAAESERWSVHRIAEAATRARPVTSKKGGRKPVLPLLRSARNLKRSLDNETERLRESLRGPLPREHAEVIGELAELLARTSRMLAAAVGGRVEADEGGEPGRARGSSEG